MNPAVIKGYHTYYNEHDSRVSEHSPVTGVYPSVAGVACSHRTSTTTDARSNVRSLDSYRPANDNSEQNIAQLLADYPLPEEGRFGCYCIADSNRYSDIARAVECTVFQQFFGNTPELMHREYLPYEDHSKFLLVVDRDLKKAAGAFRIIKHSDRGLKTLNDIEKEPISMPTSRVLEHHHIDDLDKTWEAGTMAVLKEYRGRATDHFVSTALYSLFCTEAVKAGIEHVVAILDEHAYFQLTELFAVPFVPILDSKPFSYLGSESNRAVYMHVPDARPTVRKYMRELDERTLQVIGPYLRRLAFSEGLPTVVDVT